MEEEQQRREKEKEMWNLKQEKTAVFRREYSQGKKFPQNIYFNVKILSSSFY